jgi:hypothetical protein
LFNIHSSDLHWISMTRRTWQPLSSSQMRSL